MFWKLELSLLAFLVIVIDYVYLSNIAKYFNNQIEKVQGTKIVLDFYAAGLCYLVLVLSLYYFIIRRRESILNAVLLGLSTYLIYEFTNKAILKDWMWTTVLLDGLWGGLLYGLSTFIIYYTFNIPFKLY